MASAECEGEGAGAAARGGCQRLDAMLRSLPSRCINPRSHPNTPPPHDSNALFAIIAHVAARSFCGGGAAALRPQPPLRCYNFAPVFNRCTVRALLWEATPKRY